MASSTRSELVLAWPLAALLLASTGALAAPRPSPRAQARAAALEGKKAYDTGDFAGAIQHYTEAYRLQAVPGLLFNLGQSHRKAGDLEVALSYFRRYLEARPPAGQARAAEQLIEQVEAERLARAAAAIAREAERKEAEEAANRQHLEELRLAMEKSQSDAQARRLELELAAQARQPPPPPPLTQRWWFWAGLGAVVAGGAATAIVLAQPHATPTTFPDINAR